VRCSADQHVERRVRRWHLRSAGPPRIEEAAGEGGPCRGHRDERGCRHPGRPDPSRHAVPPNARRPASGGPSDTRRQRV